MICPKQKQEDLQLKCQLDPLFQHGTHVTHKTLSTMLILPLVQAAILRGRFQYNNMTAQVPAPTSLSTILQYFIRT